MLRSMGRSIQILSVFLLLALASVVSAQTPSTCGIVGIDGPAKVDPGEALQFKVRTTGTLHTTKPEFKWTLLVGTIVGGQGTDQISVDTVGLGGQIVTVTVELLGATPGCNGSASTTTEVEPPPFSCGRPFDEYGDINFEDEKARLDNFVIQVFNIPLSSGYILMTAGQKTYRNEATKRLARAKSYLVNVRDIDSSRVITVDCGFTQDLTIKLYVALPGFNPSPCTVFQEIPFSEVKFTKPRPKASQKRR
jgi:hypothetical protein